MFRRRSSSGASLSEASDGSSRPGSANPRTPEPFARRPGDTKQGLTLHTVPEDAESTGTKATIDDPQLELSQRMATLGI